MAFCRPKAGTTGLPSFNSSKADCSVDKDNPNDHPNPAQYDATPGFKELFLGNSPKPRISIGIGFNWISPMGPLRIDLAKALSFQKGDTPKLFTFNVGTQF